MSIHPIPKEAQDEIGKVAPLFLRNFDDVIFGNEDLGETYISLVYKPDLTPEEINNLDKAIEACGAKNRTKNIPGWSLWTEQEAKDWFDTNIADLLSAIPDIDGLTRQQYDNNAQSIAAQLQDVLNSMATMNRNMARVLIAIRDQIWPKLN